MTHHPRKGDFNLHAPFWMLLLSFNCTIKRHSVFGHWTLAVAAELHLSDPKVINTIRAIVLKIGDRLVSFSANLTIFIVIGNRSERHYTETTRRYPNV